MYYELLILARLMYGPQHGYLIAKVASDMIGPWAKVSPGTLYPVLAKLVQAGFIGEIGSQAASRRDPRAYAITAAGQAHFRELMLDTASNPGDYQRRFHLKVPSFEFVTAEERGQLLDHYTEYCRTAIHHLEKESRLLVEYGPDSGAISAAGIAAAVSMMAHQTAQWQSELTWIERLRGLSFTPEPPERPDADAKTDTLTE